MEFLLPLTLPKLPVRIAHTDRIMLLGSCFTEHMVGRLQKAGFRTESNPQGILFNPVSTAHAVQNMVAGRQWKGEELFYLNELWNSWDHHSRFSHIHKEAALLGINEEMKVASAAFLQTDWLIITLGSAFQYKRKEGNRPVTNNHRAPAGEFIRELLPTEDIVQIWEETLRQAWVQNPALKVLFTVSPVRHARDGAVENNRSKGRLLDAVHTLCERHPNAVLYFPAYEIVIDVLRDYRFYDVDLVHPNYAATQYVWEQFVASCISPEARPLMQELEQLAIAAAHRPRFPQTAAHQKFRAKMAEKRARIQTENPWVVRS
jgi:hypothetical protein